MLGSLTCDSLDIGTELCDDSPTKAGAGGLLKCSRAAFYSDIKLK